MSALLIKEAPKGLHHWLKSEARFNRRSVNQQVLICLEWCMQTYGEARRRDPFAESDSIQRNCVVEPTYAHGQELASRLASLDALDDEDAKQIKADVRLMRRSKIRKLPLCSI